MDTQVCTLTFGSWTFARKDLRIKAMDFKYEKGKEEQSNRSRQIIRQTGLTVRQKDRQTKKIPCIKARKAV